MFPFIQGDRGEITLFKHVKKAMIGFIIVLCLGCALGIFSRVSKSEITQEGEKTILTIDFMTTMVPVNIEEHLHLSAPYKSCTYAYNYEWLDDNSKLRLVIEESDAPKGKTIDVVLNNLPTKYVVKKNYKNEISFDVEPELVEIFPDTTISTEGPLYLIFNTIMDQPTMENLNLGFDYDIEPMTYLTKSGMLKDYSYWVVYPKDPLPNNTPYTLHLDTIRSQQNRSLAKKEYNIRTAMKPLINSVAVEGGFHNASICPQVTISSNEDIRKAEVQFEEVKGLITIDKDTATFVPKGLLEENREYKMKIRLMNKDGEWSEAKSYKFKTAALEKDQMWVEVALGDTQKVRVYEGKDLVKEMSCSGGLPSSPTVLGTYYLKDRGERFFSQRFKEGAHHWVRITQQYLFHGIPFDEYGQTIEEERGKIGEPASHGCIRLTDEDAKWFYDNVPEKTMILIYEDE